MTVGKADPNMVTPAAEAAVLPAFPCDLDLRPVSRWPTRLPEASVAAILSAPLPWLEPGVSAIESPETTIVVLTQDNLVFNRLCLESLLVSTAAMSCEILVRG